MAFDGKRKNVCHTYGIPLSDTNDPAVFYENRDRDVAFSEEKFGKGQEFRRGR